MSGGLDASVEEHPKIDVIIIWCDGCCYQNKNANKASAIRRFAAKHNITILFKYIQVGHTFIGGDSVHRCIENALKMRDINIPEDYISVIRNARVKPFPYQVRFNSLLPHTFFKELVKDIPSI